MSETVIFRPYAAQAACGTNSAGASDFSKSRYVKLTNTHTATVLVTIEADVGVDPGEDTNKGGMAGGTFSMPTLTTVIIQKGKYQQLFAGHAGVLGVPVHV
jgi:hypothetical protein